MYLYIFLINLIIFFLCTLAVAPPKSPCQPSPCGPNSECREGPGNKAVCSCLPGYLGKPCRPECTIDSDCSLSKACVNYKCVDPCEGSCGIGAICKVVSHRPSCSCPEGYTGNPYSKCYEGKLAFPNVCVCMHSSVLKRTQYLFLFLVTGILNITLCLVCTPRGFVFNDSIRILITNYDHLH